MSAIFISDFIINKRIIQFIALKHIKSNPKKSNECWIIFLKKVKKTFILLYIVNTLYYNKIMVIEWNNEKNELLKKTRNVSFEQVKAEIEAHRNTDPVGNPAHKNQYITVVKIDDYPCVVPFVIMENGGWFLKTIYQSRKYKGKI